MAFIDLSGPAMRQLAGQLEHFVEAVAVDLRNEIVDQMESAPPRTGREYPTPGTISNRDRSQNSGPRPTYTASAPGEPPAVASGQYVAAWQSTPAVVHGSKVLAFATNDRMTEDGEHMIGDILEYGTNDGKILPRPHIRPAMENIAARFGGGFRGGAEWWQG